MAAIERGLVEYRSYKYGVRASTLHSHWWDFWVFKPNGEQLFEPEYQYLAEKFKSILPDSEYKSGYISGRTQKRALKKLRKRIRLHLQEEANDGA